MARKLTFGDMAAGVLGNQSRSQNNYISKSRVKKVKLRLLNELEIGMGKSSGQADKLLHSLLKEIIENSFREIGV